MSITQGVFDRTAGIGGSDVPAILGVSPWATITDTWMEKTHHPAWRPKDISPEMRFGTMLEPVLRDAYSQDTGRRVMSPGDKTYWAEDGYRYAHLDGLVEGEGIWEGKAPFQTWRKWDLGPPVYVHAQVQHYLDVVGEPWCDVSALAAGLDPIFQTWRIAADPEAQASIRRALQRFWFENVKMGEPPEPLPSKIQYPTHVADVMVVADPEDEQLVERLIEIRSTTKAAGATEEQIKEQLRNRIGTAAGMKGHGWRIRLKQTKDSERTDWKLVAGVWRKQLEEVERILTEDGAYNRMERVLNLLTDTAPADTVMGLYTTISPGTRPFNLDIMEDQE